MTPPGTVKKKKSVVSGRWRPHRDQRAVMSCMLVAAALPYHGRGRGGGCVRERSRGRERGRAGVDENGSKRGPKMGGKKWQTRGPN